MFFERPDTGRSAVLLQVELTTGGIENPELGEFRELTRSADIDVADVLRAKRSAPHPRWFVGEGKVAELKALVHSTGADLVLVNHDLSAGQQRTLEQELDVRVATRTELILWIFADRARTHEGMLQVELAQLEHAQTRLVRGWTHLDRQKGGIGLRGAGEKQIELDQRMLSERIKGTRKKLASVVRRRSRGRRARARRGTPTVSLVGYTNAGKSTLFNALTDSSVVVEDRLFATLDPTMRQLSVPGVGDVVLADTVGFVSQLPHSLVDAFRATLEEVTGAQLLLHVVDASDELSFERIEQVNSVLREIGADEVPVLLVYNKIDLLSDTDTVVGAGISDAAEPAGQTDPEGANANKLADHVAAGAEVNHFGTAERAAPSLQVSAVTGEGLPELIDRVGLELGVVAPHQVIMRASEGKLRALLYERDAVLAECAGEDGTLVFTVRAAPDLLRVLSEAPGVMLRVDAGITSSAFT